MRHALAAVQTRLGRFCTADGPGIAVGIARHGKPLATFGHGLANLEARKPFTPRTAFRICSLSKQFLCALIWRAARRGLLDVDAPPGRYLAAFAGLDAALTLRHLMQNRSGLRDHWVLAMWMGARAEQVFTLADGEEAIRRACDSMFAPGTQNLYCNANFVVLERVLEAVSGRSFAENLRTHLLDPLRMDATFVGVDCAAPLPGNPQGYRRHHGRWEVEENGMHWSGPAGIVSTIDDMLKWEACLSDPARHRLPFVADILHATPFADGAPGWYASGIGVSRTRGRTLISHGGALRGWRSAQHRHAPEGVAVYVFINRTESPRAVATDVARLLGAPPLWESAAPRRRAPAASVPGGFYFSREQGLLLELDADDEGALLRVFGDAVPLFACGDGAFESEDQRASLRVLSPGVLQLRQFDHHVLAVLHAIEARPGARFGARGEFRQRALGARLRIGSAAGAPAIAFDGIFGAGPEYALNELSSTHAWFEIPRGVDEMPPGRCVLFHDAASGALELSCGLARRVVFRR
jgi:D-aminopeptidase